MPFGSEGPRPGSGSRSRAAAFAPRSSTPACSGASPRWGSSPGSPDLERVGRLHHRGAARAEVERLRKAAFSAAALADEVVRPLRAFCARTVDVPAVLAGALLPFTSIAGRIEAAYATGCCSRGHPPGPARRAPLRRERHEPRHRVGFRFSKPYAGDYRIGLVRRPAVRLARAVAASSAFPPSCRRWCWSSTRLVRAHSGADLWEVERLRRRILLADGGVYDNLGLETVWKRYTTVIASDAGEPFAYRWSGGPRLAPPRAPGDHGPAAAGPGAPPRRAGGPLPTGALDGAYLGIGTPLRPGRRPGRSRCRPRRPSGSPGSGRASTRFSTRSSARS